MFKCFNRKLKVTEAEPPTEVMAAFTRFSIGRSTMSADQFRLFLIAYQGQDEVSAAEDAEQIVEEALLQRKEKDDLSPDDGDGISLDEFFRYLLSDDLNGPIHCKVHHDMTAPLSHYFIFTGHNSYLTGNQLSSDCSDAPIIRALQSGVRVIELDMWPNSAKDDILVLHGRTLTSPVTLIKCLKSINLYAFVKSPYPVIITLEDHLTPELQAKVAQMVTETFGDLLYYPEGECLLEFPSPESLKHRIIISTKPPKEYLESKSPKNKEIIAALENDSDDEKERLLGSEFDSKSDEDQDSDEATSSDQKRPEYKRLITIHAGKPKGSLTDALKVAEDMVKRLSLSEYELEKVADSNGTDLVRFTQKNILRIYPKGTRVTSSNYKPNIGWMHGAQMVAFNMQGYGKSLWMMQGMFRANGGCGYVKKPDFLMQQGPNKEVFDPKSTNEVKMNLKVKVFMGHGWKLDFSRTHFDTFSPPDFYTKLYIIGVPADATKKKTQVIEDNWFPVWNEEFIFPLTEPELALLRIEVREYDMSDKDDFGGQTCLPISELRPGIRAVPLYDKKGEKYQSVKLLMRFQFT
ncbi:hypothetical protein SAY87_006857 [Trapa incisa]|uniref:Phosphoinositide phospholipase C n=1 Tax=Trapa incisa TaxID=236973 RepID=A0AAN7K344_9MYRT|nr:hypothetical protein SAY87_006857 [Trapa incisa]